MDKIKLNHQDVRTEVQERRDHMSNFKDFDLELKKVAGGGQRDYGPTDFSEDLTDWLLQRTLEGKCDSVDVPTGGATRACCKKNINADPKCI